MRTIESNNISSIQNCGVSHCTKITFTNGYEVHSQYDLSRHPKVPSLLDTRWVVVREGVMDELPNLMLDLYSLEVFKEPVPVTFNFDVFEGYIKGKATNFRREVLGDESEISFDIEWANGQMATKADKMTAGIMASIVKPDRVPLPISGVVEKAVIKEISFY